MLIYEIKAGEMGGYVARIMRRETQTEFLLDT
jgi:hypothetical protein